MEIEQLNCKIFRHGTLRSNGKQIDPHSPKDLCSIPFSDYDCKRSIPCLCDGLKPSLRKIMYSCFKRNLKKEIKVSQLAGYVSENSAYHHGEQSLYGNIRNRRSWKIPWSD